MMLLIDGCSGAPNRQSAAALSTSAMSLSPRLVSVIHVRRPTSSTVYGPSFAYAVSGTWRRPELLRFHLLEDGAHRFHAVMDRLPYLQQGVGGTGVRVPFPCVVALVGQALLAGSMTFQCQPETCLIPIRSTEGPHRQANSRR